MGSELERLLRWETSGGTWRVLRQGPADVVVALLTCAGDEEMGRLQSDDPEFVAYVGERG